MKRTRWAAIVCGALLCLIAAVAHATNHPGILGVSRPPATASIQSASTLRADEASPDRGTDAQSSTTAAESGDGPQIAGANQLSNVVIDGNALPQRQLEQLQTQYGAIHPGNYWHDPISGLWGLEGREPAGYVQPGLDFGQLSSRASNGDTGVFVNGREINEAEYRFYSRVFGTQVAQGRYWLDGNSGNVGYEGNPQPIDNLIRRIQQSHTAGSGSQAFAGGSMVGVTNGDCTMATTDDGYTVSTPGC